jgi:class 3 adenylate cyclase/tetratricopeptide (TPR) repeat protein
MLFSDVKGSTPMAESLDPEDVLEIMDSAFDVLIEPITRYEGALARLMGDGILAFFGAPIAHEDDAERACRAALEILDGAREYAERLQLERGIAGFNVRVGIHTGLVVVGEVGSDLRVEYTAMGDAVNLASRMEEAAEPGTVLITEDTQRLIAPLFDMEALGPMEVKGKAEPVSVYRVLAPRVASGKPRGIAGLESPLVGREAEVSALQEALTRLQVGVGGIVTIVGEAGIGKSRLVAELRKAAAPLDVTWVEGRCLSYGESMAYLPWVDVLQGLLGMSVEDPSAAVRDALRGWVEGLCPDQFDEVYPFLGRMMSLPLEDEVEERLESVEPEGLKVLTFRAVERVLESGTNEGPVVLVCEDLHWADASSLELLEQVLALTERAALLVICAFRPYRDHGCWGIREVASRGYDHRYTDMRLRPLSASDSETLVGNLLEVEALPQSLRTRILDHAEGNPFYVEEVIRSLIDSGAIVFEEETEQWEATRRVEDIAIPDTLQGVLMARIDRLEEEARRVLQLASVIGRIFLHRVLSAIAEERQELDTRLLTLQREEMIRERARVPELEYIFKHHLTRQAAYNGLLRRERRQFNHQVAEAVERLFPERIEEQLGRVAHHWEQAGDPERAVEYLRRAGEQAAAQYANTEAVAYFTRALDLTSGGDLAERYALLLAREGVYDMQVEREAQQGDLAALQDAAEALGDDARRAEVALRQSVYAHMLPDYPAAIAAAEKTVRLAQSVGDVRTEGRGYTQWAWALYWQGEYSASRTKSQQALNLARAAHLRLVETGGLGVLSMVLHQEGDFAGERACREQHLRVCREIGDRQGENWERCSLGALALVRGDCDEARACCEQAMQGFRAIGDRWHEGWAHLPRGLVYHYLGD